MGAKGSWHNLVNIAWCSFVRPLHHGDRLLCAVGGIFRVITTAHGIKGPRMDQEWVKKKCVP